MESSLHVLIAFLTTTVSQASLFALSASDCGHGKAGACDWKSLDQLKASIASTFISQDPKVFRVNPHPTTLSSAFDSSIIYVFI